MLTSDQSPGRHPEPAAGQLSRQTQPQTDHAGDSHSPPQAEFAGERHSLPRAEVAGDSHSLPRAEFVEDRQPLLWPVEPHIGPYDLTLYLGNGMAANDGPLLAAHGITSTLNLAVNLPLSPLTLPDGIELRRHHIGLIDGSGNSAVHLMSAVLALAGMLTQDSPGKASYPAHRPGNILVHCRGGRSRSVAVLALYLHLAVGNRYPTLKSALDHLRLIRGTGPEQPCGPLWQLMITCLNNDYARLLTAAKL